MPARFAYKSWTLFFLFSEVLEGAHRLGDKSVIGVANFAVAERQGRGAVKSMAGGSQARAGLSGLQKAGLHFDRHPTAGVGIERAPRHRHRHIEQGHEHAAMGDGPTVQVARLEVESDGRAALRST